MSKNLSKRHRSEKRFIAYGFISLILAATMLATIIGSMIYRSIPAYTNYSIDLEINMQIIDKEVPEDLQEATKAISIKQPSG